MDCVFFSLNSCYYCHFYVSSLFVGVIFVFVVAICCLLS